MEKSKPTTSVIILNIVDEDEAVCMAQMLAASLQQTVVVVDANGVELDTIFEDPAGRRQ